MAHSKTSANRERPRWLPQRVLRSAVRRPLFPQERRGRLRLVMDDLILHIPPVAGQRAQSQVHLHLRAGMVVGVDDDPGRHGCDVDVRLYPHPRYCLQRRGSYRRRRLVRRAGAQHAPLGWQRQGPGGLYAHVARLFHRGLSPAASTDVLTETNWQPLLFFGIAGVALLVLSRSDERRSGA